ncbi:MAG: aminomethyl-transferring glycine dehydrogenase subunit GcvPA [Legionellales bacterium]|nr:aminomethyl-transferring glycine dehydrogenase subunit GcvPA [Legionellales bacterium]
MPFIPHTEQDIASMLAAIGVDDIENLFDEIPSALKIKQLKQVPPGINEMQLSRLMNQRADTYHNQLCFIGAGSYEHHIPAAVWELTTRGEFMTAYTPYQAEASQGNLQLMYEYQTMMANLMGMEVSNASLYEGASAVSEAVLMALRANRKSTSHTVLVPKTLHPNYREVLNTILPLQNIHIIELEFDPAQGRIDPQQLQQFNDRDISAIVIPQPNFFGVIENVDAITDWAKQQNCMSIGVVNPIVMAYLKEPGQWGAEGVDIACGEGQPLGIPMASGGPYFGFLCCKKEFVRQMPGRLVGRTVDSDGKPGFALTLQAREQHIRRAKATSNICTNQGLMVIAATIYMSLLGPTGLQQVAEYSHYHTQLLHTQLMTIPGVKKIFNAPFFHEIAVQLPVDVNAVLREMAKHHIQAGCSLTEHYPQLENALLVCATETKTEADIHQYVNALKNSIQQISQGQHQQASELC